MNSNMKHEHPKLRRRRTNRCNCFLSSKSRSRSRSNSGRPASYNNMKLVLAILVSCWSFGSSQQSQISNTLFTSCTATTLTNADTTKNGWLDQHEFELVLFQLAPSHCNILGIYEEQTKEGSRGGLLKNIWKVVTCICRQYDEGAGQDACCNAENPMIALPGIDSGHNNFPEPTYTNRICQIVERGIITECARQEQLENLGRSTSTSPPPPSTSPPPRSSSSSLPKTLIEQPSPENAFQIDQNQPSKYDHSVLYDPSSTTSTSTSTSTMSVASTSTGQISSQTTTDSTAPLVTQVDTATSASNTNIDHANTAGGNTLPMATTNANTMTAATVLSSTAEDNPMSILVVVVLVLLVFTCSLLGALAFLLMKQFQIKSGSGNSDNSTSLFSLPFFQQSKHDKDNNPLLSKQEDNNDVQTPSSTINKITPTSQEAGGDGNERENAYNRSITQLLASLKLDTVASPSDYFKKKPKGYKGKDCTDQFYNEADAVENGHGGVISPITTNSAKEEASPLVSTPVHIFRDEEASTSGSKSSSGRRRYRRSINANCSGSNNDPDDSNDGSSSTLWETLRLRSTPLQTRLLSRMVSDDGQENEDLRIDTFSCHSSDDAEIEEHRTEEGANSRNIDGTSSYWGRFRQLSAPASSNKNTPEKTRAPYEYRSPSAAYYAAVGKHNDEDDTVTRKPKSSHKSSRKQKRREQREQQSPSPNTNTSRITIKLRKQDGQDQNFSNESKLSNTSTATPINLREYFENKKENEDEKQKANPQITNRQSKEESISNINNINKQTNKNGSVLKSPTKSKKKKYVQFDWDKLSSEHSSSEILIESSHHSSHDEDFCWDHYTKSQGQVSSGTGGEFWSDSAPTDLDETANNTSSTQSLQQQSGAEMDEITNDLSNLFSSSLNPTTRGKIQQTLSFESYNNHTSISSNNNDNQEAAKDDAGEGGETSRRWDINQQLNKLRTSIIRRPSINTNNTPTSTSSASSSNNNSNNNDDDNNKNNDLLANNVSHHINDSEGTASTGGEQSNFAWSRFAKQKMNTFTSIVTTSMNNNNKKTDDNDTVATSSDDNNVASHTADGNVKAAATTMVSSSPSFASSFDSSKNDSVIYLENYDVDRPTTPTTVQKEDEWNTSNIQDDYNSTSIDSKIEEDNQELTPQERTLLFLSQSPSPSSRIQRAKTQSLPTQRYDQILPAVFEEDEESSLDLHDISPPPLRQIHSMGSTPNKKPNQDCSYYPYYDPYDHAQISLPTAENQYNKPAPLSPAEEPYIQDSDDWDATTRRSNRNETATNTTNIEKEDKRTSMNNGTIEYNPTPHYEETTDTKISSVSNNMPDEKMEKTEKKSEKPNQMISHLPNHDVCEEASSKPDTCKSDELNPIIPNCTTATTTTATAATAITTTTSENYDGIVRQESSFSIEEHTEPRQIVTSNEKSHNDKKEGDVDEASAHWQLSNQDIYITASNENTKVGQIYVDEKEYSSSTSQEYVKKAKKSGEDVVNPEIFPNADTMDCRRPQLLKSLQPLAAFRAIVTSPQISTQVSDTSKEENDNSTEKGKVNDNAKLHGEDNEVEEASAHSQLSIQGKKSKRSNQISIIGNDCTEEFEDEQEEISNADAGDVKRPQLLKQPLAAFRAIVSSTSQKSLELDNTLQEGRENNTKKGQMNEDDEGDNFMEDDNREDLATEEDKAVVDDKAHGSGEGDAETTASSAMPNRSIMESIERGTNVARALNPYKLLQYVGLNASSIKPDEDDDEEMTEVDVDDIMKEIKEIEKYISMKEAMDDDDKEDCDGDFNNMKKVEEMEMEEAKKEKKARKKSVENVPEKDGHCNEGTKALKKKTGKKKKRPSKKKRKKKRNDDSSEDEIPDFTNCTIVVIKKKQRKGLEEEGDDNFDAYSLADTTISTISNYWKSRGIDDPVVKKKATPNTKTEVESTGDNSVFREEEEEAAEDTGDAKDVGGAPETKSRIIRPIKDLTNFIIETTNQDKGKDRGKDDACDDDLSVISNDWVEREKPIMTENIHNTSKEPLTQETRR